jgi:hypothetical protein
MVRSMKECGYSTWSELRRLIVDYAGTCSRGAGGTREIFTEVGRRLIDVSTSAF